MCVDTRESFLNTIFVTHESNLIVTFLRAVSTASSGLPELISMLIRWLMFWSAHTILNHKSVIVIFRASLIRDRTWSVRTDEPLQWSLKSVEDWSFKSSNMGMWLSLVDQRSPIEISWSTLGNGNLADGDEVSSFSWELWDVGNRPYQQMLAIVCYSKLLGLNCPGRS